MTDGATDQRPPHEPLSRWTQTEDVRVHYQSYGAGPSAVMFLHGWTCDSTFWRRQQALCRRHRSVLVDLPGHGKSSSPKRRYPLELFASAVKSICVGEGITSAVLVGHSFGSAVAYTFARMFASRTKALILVEPRLSNGCIEYQDYPNQRFQL